LFWLFAMIITGTVAAVSVMAFDLEPQAGAASEAKRAAGRDLYLTHCASCHGPSGRGDGPAADSMRRRPTDLTQFARANGGVFPSERTRNIIDGRGVGAHGSVEMPVWGAVFKATGPNGGEAAARDRIDAIVAYLEAIQERQGIEP
jgi:mono/diheme cytochrome c family protein